MIPPMRLLDHWMVTPRSNRPLTLDELDTMLEGMTFTGETIPVIMSLETRDKILAAMDVWRRRKATIELRAHVYRVNAGNRRRQQRR